MRNNIMKSILAGILIGLGVIINLKSENPIIGAFLFSFGLLTIINMKLNLFTGKIGFISDNKISFLLVMLIFNFIGIGAAVALYAIANQNFIDIISAAAATKFSKNIFVLFINGCFCGALIHFAVKNKHMLLTILAIMIFILMGAEHCIADFPYLLFNFSLLNLFKLISIIIGNSVGAICIERLTEWNVTLD